MSNLTDFFPSASGGGGGTPIGGYTFFETPPNYTGFVSGQEVWTDASSQVWLKTEAVLTSAGTGVLDASLYTNSVKALIPTSTVFDAGINSQMGAAYNGKHIIGNGPYSNYQYVSYTIRDVDGGSVSSANNLYNTSPWSKNDNNGGQDLWSFGSSFGNDTHAFTTYSRTTWNGSAQTTQWAFTNRYAYTPYTSFTGGTAGYTTSNQSTYWSRIQSQQYAVTHIETTPRYWMMGFGSTGATEMSFDSTTSNGGDPFTAVSPSNTVNFGTTVDMFRSDGVDKFYSHTGTVLKEFSLNGTLLNTFTGVPGEATPSQYGYSNFGVMVIPPFRTTSGNTEFWFPQSTTPSPKTNFTKYELVDTIKGPVYTSGTAGITLAGVGDVAVIDNLLPIYMWKRIA